MLKEWTAQLQIAAKAAPRYDNERVLIIDAFETYCRMFGSTPKGVFWRLLTEAHQGGLISLNRLDLTTSVSEDKRKDSLLIRGPGHFHLIVL